MANTAADLLRWRENNQDQGLQYWLFCSSFYLCEGWVKDKDGNYKIHENTLENWMKERFEELKREGNSPWAVRRDSGGADKTKYSDSFLTPVLKSATTTNPVIANMIGKEIILTPEIYIHSNKYSELFFRIDSITMADRIVRWTDDNKQFIDGRNAIWHMFGWKDKRERYGTDFENYLKKNKTSFNCAYCKKEPWQHTDHIFPWSISGRGFHHQANWIPSCSDCNLNKSDDVLGLNGWEKVMDFYTSNRTYVDEMKSQLKKKKIDWEEHFIKMKTKYEFYDEDKQGWNSHDERDKLGSINDIQKIIHTISKM